MMSTMMACPELMEQEQSFQRALGTVANWRLDGQHLDLLDGSGTRVLRFEARAFP